jgi:hypothetical protein
MNENKNYIFKRIFLLDMTKFRRYVLGQKKSPRHIRGPRGP